MKRNNIKRNIKANYHVYALASWFAIMALFLALGAGQVGCQAIKHGISGSLHGAASDWDGFTKEDK